MSVMEILDKRSAFSFEVFPPKTDTAFASVKAATEEIADLHPAFISVTYGAGGGTSRYTLEIAKIEELEPLRFPEPKEAEEVEAPEMPEETEDDENPNDVRDALIGQLHFDLE